MLARAVAAKARVSPAEAPRRLVGEAAAAKAEPGKAAAAKAASEGAPSPRGKAVDRREKRPAAPHPAVPAPSAPADAVRVQSAQLPPVAAAPAQIRSAAASQGSGPRIQVTDLRKKPAAAERPSAEPRSAAERAESPAAAVKPFAERLAASGEPRKAAPAAPAAPLERIREMTGSDLVRTVGLVVRDGGGEIRLTLKPESLGSVRIRLSIEDGKVEGRIVVDTPEARQAFEAGIDSLTRALQADGFRTGSLEVSVSGGNANDSRQAAGLLGDTIRGARLRASDEALQAAVLPLGGDGLVNVFA